MLLTQHAWENDDFTPPVSVMWILKLQLKKSV